MFNLSIRAQLVKANAAKATRAVKAPIETVEQAAARIAAEQARCLPVIASLLAAECVNVVARANDRVRKLIGGIQSDIEIEPTPAEAEHLAVQRRKEGGEARFDYAYNGSGHFGYVVHHTLAAINTLAASNNVAPLMWADVRGNGTAQGGVKPDVLIGSKSLKLIGREPYMLTAPDGSTARVNAWCAFKLQASGHAKLTAIVKHDAGWHAFGSALEAAVKAAGADDDKLIASLQATINRADAIVQAARDKAAAKAKANA